MSPAPRTRMLRVHVQNSGLSSLREKRSSYVPNDGGKRLFVANVSLIVVRMLRHLPQPIGTAASDTETTQRRAGVETYARGDR